MDSSLGPAWLFVALLLVNLLKWLCHRSKTGYIHLHKARLAGEIAALRKQAEAHNTPALYVKCAKFTRLANAKEKELAALQAHKDVGLQDRVDAVVSTLKVRQPLRRGGRQAAHASSSGGRLVTGSSGDSSAAWHTGLPPASSAAVQQPQRQHACAAATLRTQPQPPCVQPPPLLCRRMPRSTTTNRRRRRTPPPPQVLLIGLAVVAWWGKALMHIPPHFTWPFNRLLSFPHASTYLEGGAVTVLPWMAMCDRVSALLARVAFPQPSLDLRTQPLSTVQEEPEQQPGAGLAS